ncbi:MAG: asparagine synthase (glutamine-hydrolyzing) [Saprospiraceae bacterium]|nr:asparagine synthase (glutamine-hydrolyzing) [Saprospiraceae bacterium]
MCGICGIIDHNQQLDVSRRDDWVRQMNAAITHRGPDEAGYRSTPAATLAMRRLSIIDLKSGQQPIYNEDKKISVFFNGEIYNFPELREWLLEKGHSFYTYSDTEVLVHLYEEFGFQGMLERVKGMFALVLQDDHKGAFYLARDRFGEKPLFYYQKETQLFFSSEIASLLEAEPVPRKLNQDALPYYLRMTIVPEPQTLLQEVHSLKPGHFLHLIDGQWTQEAYFVPSYEADSNIKTEQDAIEYIEPILEQAVKQQMISDVPLGAFLSGGIDSSTVVAWMQKNSPDPIKTFTVRFEESGYDESPIAREVSQLLGTDHTEITIPNQDFSEEIFWTVIDHVGLPFPDSSAIPTYLITKEIRTHVTVALSGDGGDELFGGYPIFQWWPKIARLQNIPAPIRSMAQAGVGIAGNFPGTGNNSTLRQLRRALEAASVPKDELGIAIQEMFSLRELAKLKKGGFRMPVPNEMARFPDAADDWSDLRRAMYYRLIHNLPLDMLIKVDRMSMANSLEVRAPFLDPDLFEASTKLPERFLIKDGKGKHLIRKIMEGRLPDSVFNHPKSGFSIPLHQYQNASFEKLVQELLNPGNVLYDLFDPEYLKKIIRSGLIQKGDTSGQSVFRSSHQLWSLMQLFGWAQRFRITL